jgi:hypothetical protein
MLARVNVAKGDSLSAVEAQDGLRFRLRRENGEGRRHHAPLSQYPARSRAVTAKSVWIEELDVLTLRDQLLAFHGGAGGVRDGGLLQSALARARQLAAYGDSVDAIAMATTRHRQEPSVRGRKQADRFRRRHIVSSN